MVVGSPKESQRPATVGPDPTDERERSGMDGRTCLMGHPSIMCIRQIIYLSTFCGREESRGVV